jgi:pSer/pThr/pTyr-binding forkhead associated (FHA) protein
MERSEGNESSNAALKLVVDGELIDTIALKPEVTVIGRAKGDIILDDPEISSSHCKIQLLSGAFHIFDLNSTNGTFLNGQKIVKARLSTGDRIRVGKVELIFGTDTQKPAQLKAKRKLDLSILTISPENLSLEARQIDDLIEKERLRQLSSMCLILDVSYSDGSKERLELPERAFVIGRTSPLGSFHRDEEISRKHARISVDVKGEIIIEDLKSTNGTFVNNERIQGVRNVSTGDLIKVGDSFLKVSLSLATDS